MATLSDPRETEIRASVVPTVEGPSPTSRKTRARAQVRVANTSGDLLVASDLTGAEPVTDAEIALVLGVLCDTLLNILRSEEQE